MNLHQLRIFATVAARMSFSAAAADLYMSQPAVSLQVRSLEQSLGARLFDRSGGALKLTEAGAALLHSATTMLHAEEEARRVIDELRGASRGKLVIGANTTGGMYLVPRILRAFRAASPGVEIVLDIDATDHICERVSQSMIDLGFVGGPTEDRRLTIEPIVEDDVVLIASPDNPLAAAGQVTIADLAGQRLVVPEARSRTRLIVERRLREAGLGVRPAMQLTGTEAVKKAVEANLGVAFVSGFAVERELAAGALTRVEVAGLRIVRHLEMIRRAQRYVTPAAAAFHRFVREFVRHRLPSPPRAVP